VGNLADVSIRAEELERFVEPWPMRDAGLVVADRGRGQARDASLLGYSHIYLRVAARARTEPRNAIIDAARPR
jgi:hypothetical protein